MSIDPIPPTVEERQRVERLIAAVVSGLDAAQAVGAVTDRLAITTALMLSEASENVYNEPEGAAVNENAPEYRRYFALSELFEAMAQGGSRTRPDAPGS